MSRRDDFLRDQDNLRRRSQKDHANKVNRDAQSRQDEYFRQADNRDQRINENLDRRDRERRNTDYKKSVFFAELQQARIEGRAPIYNSYLDVPDLEEPKPPAESPWGSLLLVAAVGITLVCGAVWMVFHYFGGIIYGLLLAVVAAYVVVTGIWVYLTRIKPPTTAEEADRADAWHPVTLTKRGIALVRDRRRGSVEDDDVSMHPDQRPPAQPDARHFDREPEPEVYRPQYFDPHGGAERPPAP